MLACWYGERVRNQNSYPINLMKKLFLAFALVACFAVSALSQGAPPWTIQEVDGSPRVNSPTLIKVTNGTLSCTGKTCTITISGGGGGSPGGSSTQVQYNAVGSFGGISGFTSDGTNVTAGSGNLRATRPRFITSIDDTNGNEVFVITATGSAVNEVTIANAATGNNPTFTASGGDANVGINFVPKGSGTIQVSGAAIVTVSATQTLTNKTLTTPIIAQISNTGTLTLPTSTDTLVGRATTDTLTNKTLSTSNTVSAALTWTAGVKQTFAPDATTAGINVGSVAGNPSAPSNADLWYNTATNELYARINGANVALGSGGGGGITIGTTTITSGTNTRVLYNNSGVVGEYAITGTGNVVMSTSPTITTPAITTSATITRDAIGTASSTGFELTNTTAAAAGAQQFSPCAILTSQGWKTAATAASQSTNWCIQNQAVEGTTNPSTNLVFSSQVNGGGYTARATLTSGGQLILGSGSSSAPALRMGTTYGFYNNGGAWVQTNAFFGINTNALGLVSGTVIGWTSNSSDATSGSVDTGVSRAAAGILEINNGSTGTRRWFTYAGAKRATSDTTASATTTLADVTGTPTALLSGRTYGFRFYGDVDSDATGGQKFAIAYGGTTSQIQYNITYSCEASGLNVITSRQTTSAGAAGQAGCTAGHVIIEGSLTTTSASNLSVQFAQNAASGSSTVRANGSSFLIFDLP